MESGIVLMKWMIDSSHCQLCEKMREKWASSRIGQLTDQFGMETDILKSEMLPQIDSMTNQHDSEKKRVC